MFRRYTIVKKRSEIESKSTRIKLQKLQTDPQRIQENQEKFPVGGLQDKYIQEGFDLFLKLEGVSFLCISGAVHHILENPR